MVDIKGKVCVVTGASSGIGEGICLRLAELGVKVIAVARRENELRKLLELLGPHCSFVSADVSRRDSVLSIFSHAEEKYGHVDIVINCAGCMYFTLTKNQHWDEWERQIDVNCKGVVNMCGGALPSMMKRKTGHLINISSDAALQIFPALTVYNASKAFVHSYTQGLRAECVGTGVRVTEILPGDVRTPLVMSNSDKEASEKVGVAIKEMVGGNGQFDQMAVLLPKDISDAVVYALTVPAHVGVHQLVIEPVNQMWGDATALDIKI
eukprot:GEMP01056278.1.p1 GENE.GEMP01056278.1~~GEMP01056278.1.p1  ORF type:complete len:266 (+),score=65.91 GEMP01056278.1:112-909(+)